MSDPDLDEPPAGRSWFMEIVRTWLPALVFVLGVRTVVFEPFRIPSGSMVPTLAIGDHVVINKASYGLWLPTSLLDIPFVETWCQSAGMGDACVPNRWELIDWGDPERGDIIVFRYPKAEHVHYIKRIVAIPGDKIRVRNNQITLNGEVKKLDFADRYKFVDDRCREEVTKRHIEPIGEYPHEVLTNAGFSGPLATFPRDGSESFEVPPGHVFVMGDNRDNSEDSRAWGLVRYDQIKGKAHFVLFSIDSCNSPPMRADRLFHNVYNLSEPVPEE